MKEKRRGMTLLQLLIAIAVICVLAVFLLPAIARSREKANPDEEYNQATAECVSIKVSSAYYEGYDKQNGTPIRWASYRSSDNDNETGKIILTPANPQYQALHGLVSPPGTQFRFRRLPKDKPNPGTTGIYRWLAVIKE